MRTKMICAVLLLVVAGACSRNKALADRLGEADRVIVTNQNDRVSITITGADVQKLVGALSTSKREWQKIDSTGTGHTLEFLKGSNHLGGVQTSHGIFWVGRTPYLDQSGTLDAVYQRFRNERAPN